MPNGWIEEERRAIEAALDRALPAAEVYPESLHRAMRYGVLGGGKRLRPLLCRAAAYAIEGASVTAAMGPACALEFIHAYSLIHDDLPALDNDDLRRGRPTCHKAFGEALAILAGDALQTLAFAQLAQAEPARQGEMLRELSAAAGTPTGMVAGQVGDVEAERGQADAATVRRVHSFKTAALIRAASVLGGLAAEADAAALDKLRNFGTDIGLAFQIVDDVLDITGSTPRMGKSVGKDESRAKATYPAIFGLEGSISEARRLSRQALAQLEGFGAHAQRLRELARSMVERES